MFDKDVVILKDTKEMDLVKSWVISHVDGKVLGANLIQNGFKEVEKIFSKFNMSEFIYLKCLENKSDVALKVGKIYRSKIVQFNNDYAFCIIYYESGLTKTLHSWNLTSIKYKLVSFDEYIKQYNDELLRKTNLNKKEMSGKKYRDNFASVLSGNLNVLIHNSNDLEWFKLVLKQYGMEHKLQASKFINGMDNVVEYIEDKFIVSRVNFFTYIGDKKLIEVKDLL